MKLAVGCVADSSPKFLDQALRLLRSWRWYAGPHADAQFHVCVVEDVSPPYRHAFEQHGAQVHVVNRFMDRHPTSNKLRFFDLADAKQADRVLLLDCDTIVVQNPERLFSGDGLTAKIADVATVSLELFERLFSRFGMPMPRADQRCTVSGDAMIPYFNTGVISLSSRAMKSLAPEWVRLNGELTGSFEELGGAPHFCEQASLSLALAATQTSFDPVGNEMNFPAHFAGEAPDSALASVDPVIIHYHWLVDGEGYLLPSAYPNVDRRIGDFNSRVKALRMDPLESPGAP